MTEPTSGTDTTSLRTVARREGNDRCVGNGQKIWTSRTEHSDLMLLFARTTPKDQVRKKTDGLSTFIVDMRAVKGLTIRRIRTMMNHSSCEVFFEDMEIPANSLVGEEGKGFRYVLSGMNAERILIAAECIVTRSGSRTAPSPTPRSGRGSAGRSGRAGGSSSRSRGPTPTCGPRS